VGAASGCSARCRIGKELALAGIGDIAAANRFIRETYLLRHNARFAKPAAPAQSVFVAADPAFLAETLCIEEERVVGPRQHGGLWWPPAAAAGKPRAGPLRQGAREGAITSGRQSCDPARTALPEPLRSRRVSNRRPDPLQLSLVFDAVKAWPASAGVRRKQIATASLDPVSTRGPTETMGRDEETGFQVEQRNQTTGLAYRSALTPLKRLEALLRYPPSRYPKADN
jgi:hypothetical protein